MVAVLFVYYGATRGLNEVQARFVAERLSQRSLFSPPAGQLAVRLRETLATDSGQASEEIDLEQGERDQLLHVLDQADLNKELDHELRDLQMMLPWRALARRVAATRRTDCLITDHRGAAGSL